MLKFTLIIKSGKQGGVQSAKNTMKHRLWDIWCKAIGSKAYRDNKKSDKVAIIRTIWVVLHVVTCIAIMLNTLRSYQVL